MRNFTFKSLLAWSCLAAPLFLAAAEVSVNITDVYDEATLEAITCVEGIRSFDTDTHSTKFRIAVDAIRGAEIAYAEYHVLFEEYLTKTAGRRFDPPIEFELVPVTFQGLFDAVESKDVDFFFANPASFSCVGTEAGATSLATVISRLQVRRKQFDLDVFGGLMMTRADNKEINTIMDFKDKIIATGSINVLMSGQAQFYEMERIGMSFVMDPKQVVFTQNQLEVVQGVLSGKYDVGFVRTDTIERTLDNSTGELVDPALFKVIQPRIYVLDNGDLFPFLHSTDVFPEWPVAALKHVTHDVSEEVQAALLALKKHADAASLLKECRTSSGMTPQDCDALPFPESFDSTARCDTTKEIAEIALNASLTGRFAGFRSSRSYFELRTMQEDAGFLQRDEDGDWKCTRADTLYAGINCPEGFYKLTESAFHSSCTEIGLSCEEYDCFCKPCVESYEVDVYEHTSEFGDDDHNVRGCDKMQLCASVQQTKSITMHAYDNREREGAVVKAIMHIGEVIMELPVIQVNGTWVYEFEFSYHELAIGILEIYVNDEQIPESPIRLQVTPRDCDVDYRGQSRVPGEDGSCICDSDSIQIGSNCFSSAAFFIIIASVVLAIAMTLGYYYLKYKRHLNDQMWLVNLNDLHFDDPVDVIGQGAFGVVLLAEYRGTKVAIKRVTPPGKTKNGTTRGSVNSKTLKSAVNDPAAKDSNVAIGRKDSNVTFEGRTSLDDTDSCGETRKADDNEIIEDLEARPQGTKSQVTFDRDFFGTMSFGKTQTKWAWLCPGWAHDEQTRHKSSILGGSTTGGVTSTNKTVGALFCPCFDEKTRQREEFILEMRLLSRLRHPCITTVMGAVISAFHDPMLVMEYMEYGSLYDLLQNDTMYAGGDVILQICRDIGQGLRYLHSSKPPILHGDLKARNILIDSRFRAKVADFGVSTKKNNALKGTPYFMAPEYLRGKTEYTTACDIYSVAIILFEIYAREDPYQGENMREVLRKVCHPRTNKRPDIPETMPPKMVDIMKKCWSPDPFYRPHAKDLDMLLMDMNMSDAEPLTREQIAGNISHKKTGVDMLYEVFPRHIADALKAGKKVEAENHEMVTIFFSDIVGFTDISRKLSATKVCEMLERLYEAFDKLARAHKVFKVETIGDAYMGVTNLDGSQNNAHVKNIAEFAIAAIDAANDIVIDDEDPAKGTIQIRVGFHSGPVVSNVIGSMNPRYGLFGDSVNTASRMESNSVSGRILCSAVSAKLLVEQAPLLPVTKRGKISVKGKGEMSVYWVGNKKAKSKSKSRSPGPAGTLGLDSSKHEDDTDRSDLDVLNIEKVAFVGVANPKKDVWVDTSDRILDV